MSLLNSLRFQPSEIQLFSSWFEMLAENGRVKGQAAAEFLKKSGLSTSHLKQASNFDLEIAMKMGKFWYLFQIWDVADTARIGSLDQVRYFCNWEKFG